MKYEAELGNVRGLLPSIRTVLIALSQNPTPDDLAAGLALYLSLKQAGKEVSIVTEGVMRVGHTNLFGVGQVQDKLPDTSGGDFTIVLSGVATPDGKVPAVEKMDYFTTGADLNLVFKVIPGQKFEPAAITPKYAGSNFDLVFVIGAANLLALGGIYAGKPEAFSGAHIVDLDNKGENGRFGNTNVIDLGASSVSEIIGETLMTLQLPFEGDIASNILSGVYGATNNLQSGNVGADTFTTVAEALKRGGQKPVPSQAIAPGVPISEPISQPTPAQLTPQPSSQPQENGFDLSKIFNAPVNITTSGSEPQAQKSQPDNFIVPPVVSSESPQPIVSHGIEKKPFDSFDKAQDKQDIPQSSAEETPTGERAETQNPEADWLTPKIFRGKGG